MRMQRNLSCRSDVFLFSSLFFSSCCYNCLQAVSSSKCSTDWDMVVLNHFNTLNDLLQVGSRECSI